MKTSSTPLKNVTAWTDSDIAAALGPMINLPHAYEHKMRHLFSQTKDNRQVSFLATQIHSIMGYPQNTELRAVRFKISEVLDDIGIPFVKSDTKSGRSVTETEYLLNASEEHIKQISKGVA